jgi:hypothetical protein
VGKAVALSCHPMGEGGRRALPRAGMSLAALLWWRCARVSCIMHVHTCFFHSAGLLLANCLAYCLLPADCLAWRPTVVSDAMPAYHVDSCYFFTALLPCHAHCLLQNKLFSLPALLCAPARPLLHTATPRGVDGQMPHARHGRASSCRSTAGARHATAMPTDAHNPSNPCLPALSEPFCGSHP